MTSWLYYPSSVFVSNGEVFFADSGNHRVRKVLRNGQLVTIAGTGVKGYNGDDQPATDAQLNCPHCVFVSSRNEVYISEREGHRIRKILQNGNIVTVAGTGAKGYNGDNIPATSAKLNSPYGIYVNDESDELYIADTYNRCIRKMLKNGNIITIAKTFETPVGVSFLSNEIYVCDQSGHCIKKVDSNGVITTIAGTGVKGRNESELATQCQLWNPSAIFVTEQQVYIADYCSHCVRKVLMNGNIVTIAGTGKSTIGDDITDHKLATGAILDGPYSVFVDKEEIYIAEFLGNRIRKIDGNGIITTIAGDVQGIRGYSGDVPFDFQKYPHIGPKNIPLIKPFPKAYHDMIIHVHQNE